MKYISNAEWPKGTFPSDNDHTTYTYDTREQAQGVCDLLKREGGGGLKHAFPLRTWVSEQAALQTPEAATPRTEALWKEYFAREGRNESNTSERVFFDMKLKELERELQAVTERVQSNNELWKALKVVIGGADAFPVDIDGMIQQVSILRTALATAEARVKELESKRPFAIVESGFSQVDAMREENADLTRQLTEAQVACEVRGEALNQAATVFDIYAKLHSEKHTSEGDRKANENRLQAIKLRTALHPEVCTDLLKRLADAERERDETDRDLLSCKESIEQIRANFSRLIAERDRLQAEVKELREALDYAGVGKPYPLNRLMQLLVSERSKCSGDHWDYWNFLIEKITKIAARTQLKS